MSRGEEFFLVDDREVVVTPAWHVACDGGGALGHPIEYMTLESGSEVVCKYCGRHYLHDGHPRAAKVRAEGQPYTPPSVAA